MDGRRIGFITDRVSKAGYQVCVGQIGAIRRNIVPLKFR